MKKYEIIQVIQTRLIEDACDYNEYLDAMVQRGSFTLEAPNLFRAVVAARERVMQDYDDAIACGESYYYPDWLEVWEIDSDGMYTDVHRYVFPA